MYFTITSSAVKRHANHFSGMWNRYRAKLLKSSPHLKSTQPIARFGTKNLRIETRHTFACPAHQIL